MYSTYESLIKYMVCKYFLPVCGWSFPILDIMTFETCKFLVLMNSSFVLFFVCLVLSKKTVLNQRLQALFLCFFQEFYTFKTHICLWSILSYFLCMMWSRDSASFFHMWANLHCWKNFSFSIYSLGMLSCQINKLYMWEHVFGLSVLFHWSIYV